MDATRASAISINNTTTTTTEPRLARLTVDLDALCANWRRLASLGGSYECAAVVKADAYGCGAEKAGIALANVGARSFFVATLGEGVKLRAALGSGPTVYVLNGPGPGEARALREAGLIPVLNDLGQIAAWGDSGACALHIDTGMNRLGLPLSDTPQAVHIARGVALVMSHLACGSTPGHPLNAVQAARFNAAAAHFSGARRSLAATAGAVGEAPLRCDLIRPGIGLYGDAGLDSGAFELTPVVRLEAPVLQVRSAAAGETVGYGATRTLTRETRLATIALGYADGYFRTGSSGYGVIDGVRCPIAGRISMDLITLEVSDAPGAQPGALVEMLGPNVPLADVARAAGTISYEVLTSLGRVARRYGSLS